MTPTHPPAGRRSRRWLLGGAPAASALLLAVFVAGSFRGAPPPARDSSPPALATVVEMTAAESASAAVSTPDYAPAPRPFPATRATARHEWAGADGLDPAVLRRLARNDLEYQRLLDKNNRIARRQLVYRKDPSAAVAQRARRDGQPLLRLTLPGLDGAEHEFEITRADLAPSGLQGQLVGRLAGHPDSTVTLAFNGGREAFTILAPSAGVYLQAEPREPGEIFLMQIDPATYVVGICGNP